MIIPVKPVKVRLTLQWGSSSLNASSIQHNFDIKKMYAERNSYNYELCIITSGYGYQHISSSYIAYESGGRTYLCFLLNDNNGVLWRAVLIDTGTGSLSKIPYGAELPDPYAYDNNWFLMVKDGEFSIDRPSLTANTYTVGYSSERLCVEFYDENSASFLFSVWAVGDTTGNAEQVFCTKVPSKNFVAKSTPSLFTVTQDSENQNLYYIACKTSGYTTTLNVTPIIDTTTGSGVGIYQEYGGA